MSFFEYQINIYDWPTKNLVFNTTYKYDILKENMIYLKKNFKRGTPMFRKNNTQQIILEDPALTLPKYLRQNLEKKLGIPF